MSAYQNIASKADMAPQSQSGPSVASFFQGKRTPSEDHAVDPFILLWEQGGRQDCDRIPKINDEISGILGALVTRYRSLTKADLTKREHVNRAIQAFLHRECKGLSSLIREGLMKDLSEMQDTLDGFGKEKSEDDFRATFLLDTLRYRGVSWPPLNGVAIMTPINEVCAFLGIFNPAFDLAAIHHELETTDRRHSIRLKFAQLRKTFDKQGIALLPIMEDLYQQ